MINKNLLKTSKRMVIILLVTVFSIAVIVACSADATEPSASQSSTIPDTGPTTPDEPEPTFPGDTYYNVYIPFVKYSSEDAAWITVVSWQDTNTLAQIWKDIIDGGKDNDGKRWIIRDGDNRQNDPLNGNYYYFDKNFDIVYVHENRNEHTASGYKMKVKEFLGGVIVKYSGGGKPGTWTVGGLYKTVLNKEKNNSKGQQGYTKYNNDNLNEFMRAVHRWEEGDLSVILMNVGYAFGNDEYGVDEYYCTVDNNYRKDPAYMLGVDPNKYLGTEFEKYWNEKLNVRVNHSWKTSEKFNFKFVSVEPYAWHLE